MSWEPLHFRVPDIKFRVLIVGRANAGKTTILQRVCDTTESPKIYRMNGSRREEVGADYLVLSVPDSSFCQIRLDPTTEVSQYFNGLSLRQQVCDHTSSSVAIITSRTSSCSPNTMVTFFTILVDSRLVMKANYKLCKSLCAGRRPHPNWRIDYMQSGLLHCSSGYASCSDLVRYCIPMENDRPALDMRFFDAICPDKNGMYSVVCDMSRA